MTTFECVLEIYFFTVTPITVLIKSESSHRNNRTDFKVWGAYLKQNVKLSVYNQF